LVDQQAGLAFGVRSIARQKFLNNVIALAITARAFGLPVVVSTSATTVGKDPYSFLLEHSSALGRQLLRCIDCLGSHQEIQP
jgi:nicotinamidase-related amidase